MKILNIIPYWGIEYGGPYVNTESLCINLKKQGHDVTILTTGKKNIKGYFSDEKVRFIQVKRFDDYFYFSLGLLRELRGIRDYDVVFIHGMWVYPILMAERYCNKYKVPYVVFTHMMLSPWSVNFRKKRKELCNILFQGRYLKKAGLLALIDNSEDKYLSSKKIQSKRIKFKSAIDSDNLPLKKPFKSKEKLNLLYLGRIHPKKGLKYLVKSLKFVKSDVELIVAGHGEDMNYYRNIKRYVDKNRLPVIFTGPVTGIVKDLIFKKSDVFILPSFDDGAPLALFEAFSYSIPALVSEGCHLPEVDGKLGFVVKQDPQQIAEKIDLLSDVKLRKKFSINARNYAKKECTWKTQIDELMREVNKICKIQ
ncbi:glycosyltransferase [Candidatus Woesearchaeota archaeon]|nr:glycosyltransferase [Candidatus Woesearchaeota archaeon]